MKAVPYKKSISKCWACNSGTLPLYKINNFPFTGRFPKKDEESMVGDISMTMCKECNLIQLEEAYSPEEMYNEYYYSSSINNTMRIHLMNLVTDIINSYGSEIPGRWLDIGCNDGFTLSIAKSIGCECFGIDPSNIIGKYFNKIFKTGSGRFINDIFPTEKLDNHYKFDVITTISMFYDIYNLKQFLNKVEDHLTEKGIWIIEMNYTKDMILNNGYDMIGHEHITYYTLHSFIKLLNKHSNILNVFKCNFSKINGGSIRIFVDKGMRHIDHSVKKTLGEEDQAGLNSYEFIKDYFNQIEVHAKKVNNFIKKLKKEGKRISIYGASTRGNTNLLLSKLEKNMIEFAYEKNTDKIGRYCPGSDILIKNESFILEDIPDYLIVMPYSFINEFLIKEKEFLKRGGKIVTLVPEIKIYDF